MTVTISDVARKAGVTKASVSFALNGLPGVSEVTRQRIMDAAAELGWKPSMKARGLSSSKAYSLGLVVARDPQLLGTDPFFPAFIAGIETTLAEHEYTLVLTIASSVGAEERSYRKLSEGGRVDGVILTDMRNNDCRIGLLSDLGLPAVTVNRPETASPFPAVSMDDAEGIRAAVEHLTGLGHTRIAHVGGAQAYIHGRSRRRAWEKALKAAGLRPDLFVESDFTARGGMAATAEILQRRDKPTAIVYANDLMAMAGLSFAQSLGLTVPGDLSITGYDNAEFGQYLNPPLTTIAADPVAWGGATAALLLRVLAGTHDGGDVILDPPRLVTRASTGQAVATRQ